MKKNLLGAIVCPNDREWRKGTGGIISDTSQTEEKNKKTLEHASQSTASVSVPRRKHTEDAEQGAADSQPPPATSDWPDRSSEAFDVIGGRREAN